MTLRPSFPTGATIGRALAVGRWLNWAWIAAIVGVADNRTVGSIRADDPSGPDTALRQPAVAWLCVAAALGLCVWGTAALRGATPVGITKRFAIAEGTLALALSAADGWVFDPGHVFETSQSLAAQFPLLAAASVGLTLGRTIGGAFGLLVGPFEWWAVVLNDFDDVELRHLFSIVATSVFFGAVGAVFGWLGALLRDLEATIADRRARDEVASVIHDTVLQTFAVVEQRTTASDPELAASVRRADRDLRSFLFGAMSHPDGDLEGLVRSAVERAVADHDAAVTTNVVDLGHRVDRRSLNALAGAVGEAVTNAVKHASSSSIVVFVETTDDGGVVASVRDDGTGFDVEQVGDGGHGLAGSIRRRMADVGGGSEIVSRPGAGTDVRLWVR